MSKIKKNEFRRKLEEIFIDNGIYLTESQDAIERIISLILEDVVGEDESFKNIFDEPFKKFHINRKITRNQLRQELRKVINEK